MPLRPDISQNYQLKEVVEQLFGRQAWLDLKETTSLSIWRKYLTKVLNVLDVALVQSIEICDERWMNAVRENIMRGTESLKAAKDFETLLSNFSATLVVHGFLQIGMMPDRRTDMKVTLDHRNWRLNQHRTVLVIQSPAQLEAMFWSEQQRLIGFEEQSKLHGKYRRSKSKLSYSKWCRNLAT